MRLLTVLAIAALLAPVVAAAAWRITYRDMAGVERVIYAKSGHIDIDDTIFRQGFE